MTVTSLTLDQRAAKVMNGLAQLGIASVDDLLALSWREILMQTNVSGQTVALIEQALAAHGLSLRQEPGRPARSGFAASEARKSAEVVANVFDDAPLMLGVEIGGVEVLEADYGNLVKKALCAVNVPDEAQAHAARLARQLRALSDELVAWSAAQ